MAVKPFKHIKWENFFKKLKGNELLKWENFLHENFMCRKI
jgi:hypothetical protein